MEIRNIAIIAHVDHGKTTLVDAILKQTHTFRENQKEMGETLIMDSSELEREKGITILSKNTSVFYKNTKINIIDTPGHADFGGEVERILSMASASLLLVDAAEGPLPQTKYVLRKALAAGHKLIVVINKIDRKDARPKEVLHDIETLFLELAHSEDHLHFPVFYGVGRDGKVFSELPEKYTDSMPGSLAPLFETILEIVPDTAKNLDAPFQMLVSTLDFDNFVGRLCIGKVERGKLKMGDRVVLVSDNKSHGSFKALKLFTSKGLERVIVDEVSAGDIVALAGIDRLTIGQTVTDPSRPESLPAIQIEEPTIKISIGPNTSPFSGREGTFISSAQIKERLYKEQAFNVGLKIEPDLTSSKFIVAGRGELQLAVLIETMRREGYELEVSRPEVIYKKTNGQIEEPFEEVTLDVPAEYTGAITETLSVRRADLVDMKPLRETGQRFIYKISSNNLIGLRNELLTKTRGTAQMHTFLLGYFPKVSKPEISRNGALVAIKPGVSLAYGLEHAQERGKLFIGPGVDVYEGMVVGVSSRDFDIEVNVCKAKKQTNVRSENADIAVQITPASPLTLEQALDFINDDELLEVTPQNLRVRKKILSEVRRRVTERNDRKGTKV